MNGPRSFECNTFLSLTCSVAGVSSVVNLLSFLWSEAALRCPLASASKNRFSIAEEDVVGRKLINKTTFRQIAIKKDDSADCQKVQKDLCTRMVKIYKI